MKKLFFVIILLIMISSVIIVVNNEKNSSKIINNNEVYFPKDEYKPSNLSDEEYNKISESTISELEEVFGKEGAFEIKKIEKGIQKIGDVAAPVSYQKVEVYSKYLDTTFDGGKSSFISKLLNKYENELNDKVKKINENINVYIYELPDYVAISNYGHIPTLEEIPNEMYNIFINYKSKEKGDINSVINMLKTDLKEAYNIITEEDSFYKSNKFEIRYSLKYSNKKYKNITIYINPDTKKINIKGDDIKIPKNEFDWNEIF